MKISVFLIILIIFTSNLSFAQSPMEGSKSEAHSYVYISVQGKAFSKKLIVQVDFGDAPDQISAGKEYSELLTNKKSYAAVLNYMVEQGFELVETLTLTSAFQGSGGTEGIIFIMKKNITPVVGH